jgi:signal transduction histidine kinase
MGGMTVGRRNIKWVILWMPPLIIGLWEYLRHTLLLPYLSMELGNWLTPFILVAVMLTLGRGLFRKLEESQEALQREKSAKAALEERERLARELHDGIAQSLFLLAVKLDRLERAAETEKVRELAGQLRGTVRVIHEDVRQAIANLRQPPSAADDAWVMPLRELLRETVEGSGAEASFRWDIPDDSLTAKEKIELHACLREALVNIRKHARASRVTVTGEAAGDGGFRCTVTDDGVGFTGDPLEQAERFGLRMIRERAARMGWTFRFYRRDGQTVLELVKPGGNTP